MAEDEEEGASSGTAPQGASADPASVALALGSASRGKADRYLEEQTALAADQRRLTALQIEKLETQEHFEQSHLHWRRFNDRMKGALLAYAGKAAEAKAQFARAAELDLTPDEKSELARAHG